MRIAINTESHGVLITPTPLMFKGGSLEPLTVSFAPSGGAAPIQLAADVTIEFGVTHGDSIVLAYAANFQRGPGNLYQTEVGFSGETLLGLLSSSPLPVDCEIAWGVGDRKYKSITFKANVERSVIPDAVVPEPDPEVYVATSKLQSFLAVKAPLASPTFTGTPTAPTAAPGTNTTQLANTAFVKIAIDNVIAGAPGALDTLKEISDQLANDEDAVAALTAALASKATAAQGAKADSALQPDGNGSQLTGITPAQIGAATAAQGTKADSAVQPSGLTKVAVGLGSADDTSDANKPISTAQQAALDSKTPAATQAEVDAGSSTTKAVSPSALKAAGVFYDDFRRADVTGTNIGTANTGNAYTVLGSGAATTSISSNKLTSNGTSYIWPTLNAPVRRFGCSFIYTSGTGAGANVNAMLISKAGAGNLTDMLHATWNKSNIAVADWRNGSSGAAIVSEVFSEPLVMGKEYSVEIELVPELNKVILRSPSGKILSGTNEHVAEYNTPYIAFEHGFNSDSVYLQAFTKLWAVEEGLAGYIDLIGQARRDFRLRTNDGFYRNRDTYLIPATGATWTNLNSGSGSINPSGDCLYSHTTAASSSVSNWCAGKVVPVLRNRRQNFSGFNWSFPVKFTFRYCHVAQTGSLSADDKACILFGTPYNRTTSGDLAGRGIGLQIVGQTLYAQVHDGTTLTTSAWSYVIPTFCEITLAYDGAGTLTVYVNGVSVGTLAGGPLSYSVQYYNITHAIWNTNGGGASVFSVLSPIDQE
jgi:hypothetical protein